MHLGTYSWFPSVFTLMRWLRTQFCCDEFWSLGVLNLLSAGVKTASLWTSSLFLSVSSSYSRPHTQTQPLCLTPAAVVSLRVVSVRRLAASRCQQLRYLGSPGGGGDVLFARRIFTSCGLGLGNSWAACESFAQGPLLSVRWENRSSLSCSQD